MKSSTSSATSLRVALCALVFSVLTITGPARAQAPAVVVTPAVGAKAPDFTLTTPSGSALSLSQQTTHGPTVLIVLRGYPGYQCPFCVKQVHDLTEHSADFAAKKASILFVYPGPPADLDQHAREFLAKQTAELPANIHLVIDPDYKMTNLYGLRWDAPHETAYPTTFILDRRGNIVFEKSSHAHGDRTTAEEILAQIPAR